VWGGFGFGGFFILVDFDRRHHHHRITNHVKNANGTVSRINPSTRARARTTANRQTAPGANTANTSRDLTPSGSARDAGRTTRDTDRSSSSPRLRPDAASGSASHSGRTFSSPPRGHFSTGGGMGGGARGGGGMGGFHGGGGMGGGARGGGGRR
jgi:hypothetical protein